MKPRESNERKAPKPRPLPKNLMPQGKMPPIMSFHDHPWLWLIKHRIFRRFLRGRLRCPCCGAVGTWKPFGFIWQDRDVRRWLCKWCGFYDGTDGRYWCAINPKIGAWDKRGPGMRTPQEIGRQEGFNPWAG